jgi:putative redox protein
VQTHLERRESHPRVFTQAVIEYLVTGHNVDETAVVRAIELSATTYCSAQAMFSKLMPIETKYHIYEDLGDGQRDLITSGIYTQAEQVAS